MDSGKFSTFFGEFGLILVDLFNMLACWGWFEQTLRNILTNFNWLGMIRVPLFILLMSRLLLVFIDWHWSDQVNVSLWVVWQAHFEGVNKVQLKVSSVLIGMKVQQQVNACPTRTAGWSQLKVKQRLAKGASFNPTTSNYLGTLLFENLVNY